MKNVTILQSVQEMQKNPLEKADFCGMMGDLVKSRQITLHSQFVTLNSYKQAFFLPRLY